MEVTKRLIEKYHLDLCSSEEKKAVEEWLMNDELDIETADSVHFPSHVLKEEMWANISEILPEKPDKVKRFDLFHYLSSPAFMGIAATSIAVVIGLFLWTRNAEKQTAFVQKTKAGSNETIQTSALHITLGEKSKANINASAISTDGNIDFCGAILIQSKKDVELTVNGICANPLSSGEKLLVKKGQTYIAVNYNFKHANELIIVNERNISSLPPVLQKEILKQFNI
jgi:hypothetical protein